MKNIQLLEVNYCYNSRRLLWKSLDAMEVNGCYGKSLFAIEINGCHDSQ
jgi:hypothetical protein